MDPSTQQNVTQPPPYYPSSVPNQQQQHSVNVVMGQQPQQYPTVIQDTNEYEPEGCSVLCTLKWIAIVLLVIIVFPIVLLIFIIVLVFCPGNMQKVEHGNM